MISVLEFSPDGNMLVTAGLDLTAKVWDPITGRLIAWLPAGQRNPDNGADHNQFYVRHAAFSPDSRRLVTCALRTVLWDATTGREQGEIKDIRTIIPVATFSPDGRLLAQGGWRRGLWNAEDLTLVRTLWGGEDVASVDTLAFTPDGDYVLSAGWYNTSTKDRAHLVLWDVDTGTPKIDLSGKQSSLECAILSRDGRLAVGWFQGNWHGNALVKAWSIPDGMELFSVSFPPHSLYGMTLSPDSRSLAVRTSGGRVRVFALPDGRERPIAIVPQHGVESMAFSPDGKVLAFLTVRSNPRVGGYDPLLELWDAFDGRELLPSPIFLPHVDYVHSRIPLNLRFSPGGSRLAASLHTGELLLFDVLSFLP